MPPDLDRRPSPSMQAGDNLSLTGIGAVHNVEAPIGGMFRESIARGAFDSALRRPDDVRALWNHDPNVVLGRTRAGTLHLEARASGLHYRVTLDREIEAHRALHRSVSRGDVTQSSFGFLVTTERWTKASGTETLPLRQVLDLKLMDVGPVAFPAYVQTTVSAEGRGRAGYATSDDSAAGVSTRAVDISRQLRIGAPIACSRCGHARPLGEVLVRGPRRMNLCEACAAEAPVPAGRRIVTSAAEARARYARLAKR